MITTFQIRNQLVDWNLKICFIICCICNLKHALKDARFILLKFCCFNVVSLHAYSSSEIANNWHKCECFPFLFPWQTLLINCVILSCQAFGNLHSCCRVLINTVLQEATIISLELAHVQPNCYYYSNWFGYGSSYQFFGFSGV